jgi:hypothetical protein
MARQKRQNRMLKVARQYLDRSMPELHGTAIRLHTLDGPPGSPRYAAMAERCTAACPHGISESVAAAGECPVRDCPLRDSIRLLLDRSGAVIQATRSGIRWR